MIIPEQEGRPVWEPVIIALFLLGLLISDGNDLLALVQGRMSIGGVARATLVLGVVAMMAWGLATSILRAIRWTPGDNDAA